MEGFHVSPPQEYCFVSFFFRVVGESQTEEAAIEEEEESESFLEEDDSD